MTTDPSYTQAIIEYFGITDVTVTKEMLATKLTPSKNYDNGLDDLLPEQREFIDSFCEPFVSKWLQ
jgi:hypothetical protein